MSSFRSLETCCSSALQPAQPAGCRLGLLRVWAFTPAPFVPAGTRTLKKSTLKNQFDVHARSSRREC